MYVWISVIGRFVIVFFVCVVHNWPIHGCNGCNGCIYHCGRECLLFSLFTSDFKRGFTRVADIYIYMYVIRGFFICDCMILVFLNFLIVVFVFG